MLDTISGRWKSIIAQYERVHSGFYLSIIYQTILQYLFGEQRFMFLRSTVI